MRLWTRAIAHLKMDGLIVIHSINQYPYPVVPIKQTIHHIKSNLSLVDPHTISTHPTYMTQGSWVK